MAVRKIVATLELTELDVIILLEALGMKSHAMADNRQPTRAIQILIDHIYRAMGVRMDR